MHLHSLKISAIGPFAGEHNINFAELAQGGIFLLEGPTGSGKSTIIDAIVFALYGKVASKDASEDRLRSTYVGPEVESRVELIFETGHGTYKVIRSPAYDRPKRRGDGTTRQNTQVQLWRMASPEALGAGEQISTRVDEVGTEIPRLIGLSREQFVQTIVLPQGEFANFLGAKPEERRGLLQKVFGTEIYEQIQEELREAKRQADRDLKEAKEAIARAVANFEGSASLDDEQREELTRLAREADADELRAAVDEHLERLTVLEQEATAGAAAAQQKRDVTRVTEQNARKTHDAILLRTDLTRRAGSLAENSTENAELVARSEAAARAGQVAAYLVLSDRAVTDLQTVEDALAAAFASVPWLPAGCVVGAQGLLRWRHGDEGPVPGPELLAEPVPDPVDPDDQIGERRESVASLRRASELESKLPAREREFGTRRSERSAREKANRERAVQFDTRPTERVLLDDARVKALGEAQQVESFTERHQRARTAHEHATAGAELVEQLAELTQRIDSAAGDATVAVEREAHLRKQRIDGMAGELARRLRPGESCVVCGSTSHPDPAGLDENHVTPDSVAEAEDIRAAAERALSDLRARNGELTNELTGHRTASGGRTSAETAEDVKSAAAALSRAQAATAEVEQLTNNLATFDAETEKLRTRISVESEWLATEDSGLKGLRESIDADAEEVRAAVDAASRSIASVRTQSATETEVDEAPGVADARTLIKDLTDQIDALGTLQKTLGARTRALEGLDRAGKDTQGALDRNQFTDAAAARAAALTDEELKSLKARIKWFDDETTVVTQGLAAPEITGLDPDVTPEQASKDVERAREVAAEAATVSEQSGQRAAGHRDLLTRSRNAADRITETVTGSAQLLEKLIPTLRMATLADATSSDNTRGLTLSTYVLARRFEEVLAAANARLREMSSGRYELQRSEEKESGGGHKLGLALRILDHNTSSGRDPATLSGGETFYVSLCLALGLADVVTAEAGGVDLGTLFVDEGFGSLDPETLELVMTELGKLREGGRLVGVVSHVEAMKSTISDRISIRRKAGGSSDLTVLAGAG